MLKLAGITLLMMGCIGLGMNKISDEKRRIKELGEIQRIILRFQSEMLYGKRTLPEICILFGSCMEEPYRTAFNEIFSKMEENDGSILENIWKERMESCMENIPLDEEEKDVLIKLPGNLGTSDNAMLAASIGQSSDLIQERIHSLKAEYENRSRVIMSISVMAGLFLVILLL